MKKVKDYLIIALGIVIMILLLKVGCNKPIPDNIPKNDTITTSDTVWSKDTLVRFKSIIHPQWDTVYKIDKIVDPTICDYARIYTDSLVDSTQTIFYTAKTIGLLDSLNLSYKLKKHPILINNNTIITKVETKIPRFSIYSGMSVLGNKTSFDIAPYININIKNNNILYSYNILENQHQIGISLKLYSSKK